MKFSVVMQCYLGEYQGAAKNREAKLIRAVDSVLDQTFQDFEIIIVADGCEATYKLICDRYESEQRIECLWISKQPLWSGRAREFGISKSSGEYIVYLDSDDRWGPNHLEIISQNIGSNDWVWFNDWLMQKDGKNSFERQCFINQKYQNGTSNICHRRDLAIKWGNGTNKYGQDDWSAVESLKRASSKMAKIPTPEYYVCHLPVGRLDV